MALPHDELVRRIISARELRGMTQMELGRRVADEGLGLHDIPKIERGDKTARPFSGAHRRVLAAVLDVPETWFTAEDPFQQTDLEERIAALEEIIQEEVVPYAGERDQPELLEQAERDAQPAPTPSRSTARPNARRRTAR